jgi:sugar phosphate isomerase/epimerase
MMPFLVNIPYSMLRVRFEEVLAAGLLPEIVFDASTLDNLNKKEARELAQRLRQRGLENTIHGPFRDLSPGGDDPKIRAVTRERLRQTLDLAEIFKPRCVVFHPGYDPWRFQDHNQFWLDRSAETWKPIVERAARMDTILALENVFEKIPTTILSLLERIASPNFGHCLDIGHFNVFAATTIENWVRTMAPHIVEIHLHDNMGETDDHLPIGQGNIDFKRFSRLIDRYLEDQPLWSLEPVREQDLEPSIQGLAQLGITSQ